MKVLTVIVNFRAAELSCKSVRAALRASAAVAGDSRIVVVDNDSRDGSFEMLTQAAKREGWTDRVEVVASGFNGGFGYGNNFAIRPALQGASPPDYIYLLNPDAFPAEDALAKLVAYLDQHPRVGIAGSYIHGVDGTPHETAFRFPTALNEFEYAMGLGVLSRLLRRFAVVMPIPASVSEVDWLAGASMLLRRVMLDKIGLFDEQFFLYFEETDLCRRAKLAGWPTVYVPGSKVAHVGSATTGMKDLARRMPRFWFDSRRHYFTKNHGLAYFWLANAGQIVGGGILRARRFLFGSRGRRPMPSRFLRDLVSHALRLGPKPGDSADGKAQ